MNPLFKSYVTLKINEKYGVFDMLKNFDDTQVKLNKNSKIQVCFFKSKIENANTKGILQFEGNRYCNICLSIENTKNDHFQCFYLVNVPEF